MRLPNGQRYAPDAAWISPEQQANRPSLISRAMLRKEGARAEALVLGALLNWETEHGGESYGSRFWGCVCPTANAMRRMRLGFRPSSRPTVRQALSPNAPDDWLLPFCPAFIVEVRSRSDRLAALQRKMAEYIDNGALLAWLIDPFQRQVHVYRPGVAPEALDDPERVSGEPELPGFVFEVRRRIFDLRQPAE